MHKRRLGALYFMVLLAACSGGDDGDDGGNADAAGGPGGPPALVGTAGQWTWTDVPGTRCMNNSETGMGVNLGTSSDLVIFLEGGGACFNAFTCASVAHANGFSSAALAVTIQNLGTEGLFDRTDPANPLRDATFVFFPYCSGDIFAGSSESGFGGRTQVGYDNVGKYLDVIVPASEPVRRVVLTGSSAGGFGALYNYPRVKTAFGTRKVFLIDDSGPPIQDQWLTPCLQTQMRDLWKLDETLPTGCAACTGADGGGLSNALPYMSAQFPDDRMAIITSTQDGVIRSFFGFGYPTCMSTQPMPAAAYTEAITSLRTNVLADTANFKMFTLAGATHVWLFSPFSQTSVGGTTLGAWLTAMLSGDAAWDHAGP